MYAILGPGVMIVTGVTGQMGYFVAQEAMRRGINVIGVARYSANLEEKLKMTLVGFAREKKMNIYTHGFRVV